MTRRDRTVVCALLLGAVLCLPAQAGLLEYVAQPEPEYRWSKIGEHTIGTTRVIDLAMTSQVWQGIPWEHTIRIYLPAEVEYPQMALLLVTGDPGLQETALGPVAAQAIGAPFAILFNIPNQPLFEGLTEDRLIAYTFSKYLETDDETWPLLLPMTKSAVKAMDTLQAFARQEWQRELSGFVVTGASKRGWTTWLVGAVEPERVRGIAPMVIDMLNLPAQMPHQLETWGAYSEQILEYTERGLQVLMGTQKGAELVRLVDPYRYRERITMPKLIVNGANDPYWVVDALNLYWGELVGPKWVLYVPNVGHELGNGAQAYPAIAAFFHAVAAGRSLPRMSWQHGEDDGRLMLTITTDPEPVAVRMWAARSQDMDFRDEQWESTLMTRRGDAFVGSIAKPAAENIALFGEAEFEVGGRTFTLSTQVRVVPRN